MEADKFTPEQYMFMEKQKLSPEQLEQRIQYIIDYVKMGRVPSSNPVAVIVGGQPGAGKSGVIGNSVIKLDSNCVVVDNDEYRMHHPNVEEINAVHPEIYTECTDQLSFAATPRVIASMIDGKYNMVIHQTLKNDTIIKCAIADLMKAGYTVIVRALAVSELKSNLSMIGRCQDQLATDDTCRWVPQENHDYAYRGLPETVGHIEELGAYHLLEVLTRKENEPENPNVVYRKRNPLIDDFHLQALADHGFGEANQTKLGSARNAVIIGRQQDFEEILPRAQAKIDAAKAVAKTPEEFVRIKRVEDELLMTALRTNVAKKPEDPQGPVGPSSN